MLEDEEEDEEEEEEEGRWDSDPEPPVLLVSDLNDDLLSGSYLTVTLQRPHKAKRHAGKTVDVFNINTERCVCVCFITGMLCSPRLHRSKARGSHGSEDSRRSPGLHPEKDWSVQNVPTPEH